MNLDIQHSEGGIVLYPVERIARLEPWIMWSGRNALETESVVLIF